MSEKMSGELMKERLQLAQQLAAIKQVASPALAEHIIKAIGEASKTIEELTFELAKREMDERLESKLLKEVKRVIKENDSYSLDDEGDKQALLDEIQGVFDSVELPHGFTAESFIENARDWIECHGDEGSIPLIETGIHLVEQLLME